MSKVKIAGAPILWGVCEVPNWGYQMEASRVLKEMADLGLGATEFGPAGFLPVEAEARAKVLQDHNMIAVGGFFPVKLHLKDYDPMPAIEAEIKACVAAKAEVIVLSADTGLDGYDTKRPELDDAGWAHFTANLDKISDYAASFGITAVLHPHVGTMVETQDDVMHVLRGSKIQFCLDTGHMIIGGTDPVAFARNHADRIAHSHLKDVNLSVARRVQSGEITYYQGILEGMYVPLGEGDADIAAIVTSLVKGGYDGWFVLEQDNVIHEEPAPGAGPFANAKKSVDFINKVVSTL